MFWQREVVRSSAVWTRGGTFRMTLPDKGLLGAIVFHARVGPSAVNQRTFDKWRLMDYISELKVVGNGNRVLKAITGRVGHYLQFLDGGQSMLDVHMNYGTSQLRHHGVVTFGRHLFDTQFGLDLSAWDSIELQFTNDAGSAFTGNNFALDLIFYWMREAPGAFAGGYFKTEEWRKWTTVQDEKVRLTLPTEELLRRIIIQVDADEHGTTKHALTTLYNVAYGIELKLRSGEVEMWNSGLRDLWYDNALMLGREQIVGIQPYHLDGYGIRTGLGQSLAFAGARLPQDGAQDTASTSIVPGDDGHTLRRMTDTDDLQDALLIAGLALENCAFFPFDLEKDPSQYLDLAAEGTVQLNIHTRSGANYDDGTIRVILDRLIRGQGPRG